MCRFPAIRKPGPCRTFVLGRGDGRAPESPLPQNDAPSLPTRPVTAMFSYLSPDLRVPSDRPLREVLAPCEIYKTRSLPIAKPVQEKTVTACTITIAGNMVTQIPIAATRLNKPTMKPTPLRDSVSVQSGSVENRSTTLIRSMRPVAERSSLQPAVPSGVPQLRSPVRRP